MQPTLLTMLVFAIIAPAADTRLQAAVEREFPENYFQIAPGQYLVAVETGTTPEVTARINEPAGSSGRFIAVPRTNYGGWHTRDIWEWIASRQAAPASPEKRFNG